MLTRWLGRLDRRPRWWLYAAGNAILLGTSAYLIILPYARHSIAASHIEVGNRFILDIPNVKSWSLIRSERRTGYTQLVFRHSEDATAIAWAKRSLWREQPAASKPPELYITLRKIVPATTVGSIERDIVEFGSRYISLAQFSTRRISHPMGPAIEVTTWGDWGDEFSAEIVVCPLSNPTTSAYLLSVEGCGAAADRILIREVVQNISRRIRRR